MFVIEQPIPPAPVADSMKGYVDQLERLGYVLPQDLTIGLILNDSLKILLDLLLKKKKQVGSVSSSGFREARNLKQGALYLYMGNGVRAQVEAIASYDLVLPNDLVICLDNFSKNNVHYFNVIPSNSIYEIDMHDLVPNVNSIYNVSTKRAKHNLDSIYLWHCRLAHISKKHIEKLQREGILKSTDDESFDQCVSCLSGKMTRKIFPHRPERTTDLLGIIHTDVCGPLRHVSRQGAGYFITFKDDHSRYGYVYLLKHKHEVFETFKVFKNEVENQPGKTIKALQSDRGGEYISQEFKDYLKSYGITQQLTPPYTPQHNGMSEKSATCILNMVPTKKVDKTPYELWYGKVPNLSYLKEIQDEDTSPSEITSESPMEVEGFEPPQKEVIPIRVVDWKRSKQSTTAMSATEAEYIAALEAAIEAVWIRKFISRLGARHYHRIYHYVRESIALGEIRFLKVHTDDNLVDPFTKALPKGNLTQHARSMGLRLASSFM
ncbi:retrotransposon protein, putative, ty1-copia subclass [Tanacetum coccineum]|uniref:Retrotransposon protein, putative, ty1-copia subclass n=1 Tax=Tanacetum coccineum TaxID=301880 RepID=A0ABQ5J3V7_9ASTR